MKTWSGIRSEYGRNEVKALDGGSESAVIGTSAVTITLKKKTAIAASTQPKFMLNAQPQFTTEKLVPSIFACLRIERNIPTCYTLPSTSKYLSAGVCCCMTQKTQPKQETFQLLTYEQVAARLVIEPRTVAFLVAQEGLPVVYLRSRNPRIDESDLRAWIEKRKVS